MPYIHNDPEWPHFRWDEVGLSSLIAAVRHKQGLVVGRMGAVGFGLADMASLETLTQDVLTTSLIEGETLDPVGVRSSLARRLGIPGEDVIHAGQDVEGIVELMLDATGNFAAPLTADRLFAWHRTLFPLGTSGLRTIRTGAWRRDDTGPMQVVSGPIGHEGVHYEAPAAGRLEHEMTQFLAWMEKEHTLDPVVKSGIGHFWFVTLHPFVDGNGRMARAIGDLLLARSDGQKQRFYSLSSRVSAERSQYYVQLESAQRGGLDVTPWIDWYLRCLDRALGHSDLLLSRVIAKHRFWANHGAKVDNPRQKKILDKLLDDSLDTLNTSNWARVAKCSQDTALRDIQRLIDKGVLVRLDRGGRSTAYGLAEGLAGDFTVIQPEGH
jgi:Fic family protein